MVGPCCAGIYLICKECIYLGYDLSISSVYHQAGIWTIKQVISTNSCDVFKVPATTQVINSLFCSQ